MHILQAKTQQRSGFYNGQLSGSEQSLSNRRRQFETSTKNTQGEPHADPMSRMKMTPLNCLLAPGFDPIQFTDQMELTLESDGGYLDQSYLYWEHQNARAWCRLTEQKEYLPERGFPYQQVCNAMRYALGRSAESKNNEALEFLLIGPGNGRRDLRLVQEFLEIAPETKHILLNLLDISQPLLAESFKRAQNIFERESRITTWAIQGNMYQLPHFYPLEIEGEKLNRRRVVVLIDILHNLQNESLFVQNALRPMNSGDLLFVVVSSVYASTAETSKICEKDPRLNGMLPKMWNTRIDELLTGPFERHYGRRLKEISLTPKLDISPNCLPNSYAINMVADLLLSDNRSKQFVVQRFVRYDANSVIDMFEQSGFGTVDVWRHGKNNDYLLFLLQKK